MTFAPFSILEATELAEDFSFLKQNKIVIDNKIYKIKIVTVVPYDEVARSDIFNRFNTALNPTSFMQPSFHDALKYILSMSYKDYDVYIVATRKTGKSISVKFVPLLTYVTDKGEFDQGFELSLQPDYKM